MRTLRRVARPSPSVCDGGVGERVGGIVDEREHRRGDLVAQPVGEQRAALQHGLAVHGAGQDPDELGRDVGVEDDGHAAARGLDGAEQAGGPLGGVGRGRVDVELGRLTADREAEAGLGVAVVGGERVGAHVAGGVAPGGPDAGGGDHHALAHAVGVVGRLDAADARVGRADGPLELEGQRDLAVGGDVEQPGSVQVEVGHRHAVGLGQAEELVGGAEAGVVAGLVEDLGSTSASRLPA